MIEMFQEWYENRHEYAKEWKKKTGGKVMGYFCTYVPEEIYMPPIFLRFASWAATHPRM